METETKPELAYMDLLYFGYDFGETESKKHEEEFIKEIREKFPNVKLQDAYDSIKGYRQEVYLEKENKDNYFSWLFGKGWFEMSMTMQLIMMTSGTEPEQKILFDRYFKLAKTQYPEAFKPEAL